MVLITLTVYFSTVKAHVPEKLSYQAVIRDENNQLVRDTNVGMRISILRGSATGTAVYIETHTPMTNANGLVTIEIGTGNVVSGNFSTIDWANDIYFIKTETDPAGGTNYTITGTSQVLSVPYALHAKTADSISGGVTETDPVYSSSQAANITAADITKLSNLSGTNTGDQTISRTGLTVTLTHGGSYQDSVNVYTAGDGIDITNNVVSKHKYHVGDFAQGGIVFWVDETGEHGLVCAKSNFTSLLRWWAGSYIYTMATGDGPYAGELNTAIIIAGQGEGNGIIYAARGCNELQITEGGKTYGDWYLPSKAELFLMYKNRAIINATATAHGGSAFGTFAYWSSTESWSGAAEICHFSDGSFSHGDKSYSYRVRAIRAF